VTVVDRAITRTYAVDAIDDSVDGRPRADLKPSIWTSLRTFSQGEGGSPALPIRSARHRPDSPTFWRATKPMIWEPAAAECS
jgi:hypothetical protein